jgi:hypothetical protein
MPSWLVERGRHVEGGEVRASGAAEVASPAASSEGYYALKNPLDTLTGTIVSGLIITIVLYVIVKAIPVGT